MISPFKRFFGGIAIGVFLSIPFLHFQNNGLVLEGMAGMASTDTFLAFSMAFLALTFGCVGAMATRGAKSSLSSPSTVELFRQRRKRHIGHQFLR